MWAWSASSPDEFDQLVSDGARIRVKYGLSAKDLKRLRRLRIALGLRSQRQGSRMPTLGKQRL
jgi:hypothetical protein